MSGYIVHIEGAIVSVNIKDATSEVDAEMQADEILRTIDGNINIDGCEITVTVLGDCGWCGNEFDEDDLSLMVDTRLACAGCYEEAMSELGSNS